jgi:hypothetical protein
VGGKGKNKNGSQNNRTLKAVQLGAETNRVCLPAIFTETEKPPMMSGVLLFALVTRSGTRATAEVNPR